MALQAAKSHTPYVNETLDRLSAYVSVKSLGQISLFSGAARIDKEHVGEYTSDPRDIRRVCSRLQELGFEIERVGRLSVRVSAPADLFRQRLGLQFERRATPDEKVVSPWNPFLPTMQTAANLLDSGVTDVEGFVFPQPVQLHAPPSANPPSPWYHHVQVPDGVLQALNGDPVHAQGFRGLGVRAAMIDSGFHWTHPYFATREYDLTVSLPPSSDLDANGHGTGESANFLALAPAAKLHGLAIADIIEALQVARDDLAVQVITNSWGSAFDTDGPNGSWDPFWSLVQAEIALCVQQGIVVLFSGGNGGMSFTASMPETISVGGVYIDAGGNLRASDYASSFVSTRFPGQRVPDVCGLTGLAPRAIYITLPLPPGSEIDVGYGGGEFPNGDETGTADGWGVFSGTSAACPMVAGVAALILSKHPNETPEDVRQRLIAGARDVVQGHSAMGDPATPGPDLSTGHGLVDALASCA